MKIISPFKMKFAKEPAVKEAIKLVNKSIKHNHGLLSFCDIAVIENWELPLDLRNRISKIYIKKGWKYIYHATSKQLSDTEDTEISCKNTYFLFAQSPISKENEEDIDSYILVSK